MTLDVSLILLIHPSGEMSFIQKARDDGSHGRWPAMAKRWSVGRNEGMVARSWQTAEGFSPEEGLGPSLFFSSSEQMKEISLRETHQRPHLTESPFCRTPFSAGNPERRSFARRVFAMLLQSSSTSLLFRSPRLASPRSGSPFCPLVGKQGQVVGLKLTLSAKRRNLVEAMADLEPPATGMPSSDPKSLRLLFVEMGTGYDQHGYVF